MAYRDALHFHAGTLGIRSEDVDTAVQLFARSGRIWVDSGSYSLAILDPTLMATLVGNLLQRRSVARRQAGLLELCDLTTNVNVGAQEVRMFCIFIDSQFSFLYLGL